jgi:hypothetical protein
MKEPYYMSLIFDNLSFDIAGLCYVDTWPLLRAWELSQVVGIGMWEVKDACVSSMKPSIKEEKAERAWEGCEATVKVSWNC